MTNKNDRVTFVRSETRLPFKLVEKFFVSRGIEVCFRKKLKEEYTVIDTKEKTKKTI